MKMSLEEFLLRLFWEAALNAETEILDRTGLHFAQHRLPKEDAKTVLTLQKSRDHIAAYLRGQEYVYQCSYWDLMDGWNMLTIGEGFSPPPNHEMQCGKCYICQLVAIEVDLAESFLDGTTKIEA